MSLSERLEFVHALLEAGQFEEALPDYREVYASMARGVLESGLRRGLLIEIPGEAYLDLYFGHSKHLNAYKIGISRDAVRRAKEIRSTNTRHNAGRDYELWDFATGPALAVRASEKHLKDLYAHAMVMGTEWISATMEDASDEYWVQKDHVFDAWEKQMRAFDPLAQLDRQNGILEMLVGSLNPQMHVIQIGKQIMAWRKIHNSLPDTDGNMERVT